MNFEVTVEGNFVRELTVKASSEEEAIKIAKSKVDKEIGFNPEDYVFDMITLKKVE